DVGPARSQEPALCGRVGVVRALVAEVPVMDLPAALPQRILPALVWPGDETVERDRHVAGGVRHRRPPGSCNLQASAPYAADSTSRPAGHSQNERALHLHPKGRVAKVNTRSYDALRYGPAHQIHNPCDRCRCSTTISFPDRL